MQSDSSREAIVIANMYESACLTLTEVGFVHISSPSYRHSVAGDFKDATHYACFIRAVADGYIHVAVAKSKLRDINNNPRVKIACSMQESEHSRGHYSMHFPWDTSLAAIEYIHSSTERLMRLRSNPNFIPGLPANPQKLKIRAFASMFIARFKYYFPSFK